MANKTVWDLALEIGGKDKGASEAIRRVTKSIKDAQKAMNDAKKAWGDFGKSAGKLALGVAAGIVAVGAGVLKLAGDFAAAGDQAAKTADALGMSIEGYQKLKFAMGDSGIEAAEFDGALQKMSNTIKLGAAGNKAAAGQLEAIGLSADKLNKMRPEEAFERISDYMATLPNDAKRTEMAIQLFGKTAGPKMAAAMKMGSKGIQALGAEAESLGIIMSTEQARASEEYNNQLSRMKLSITGVKNSFIGGAIGPITEAFSTLSGSIKDQIPNIQEMGKKFGEWMAMAVQKLPDIIAKIKEIASSIWGAVTRIKDFVGGWKNLAIAIGILMSLKTVILGVKAVMSTVIAVQKALNVAKTVANAIMLKEKAAWIASKVAMVAHAVASKAAAAAQWLVNAAMNANPIGLIIAGIVALIAIIVLLIKNWDSVKNAAGKAWTGIKNTAGKAWEGIKAGASKAGSFLKNNWKTIAIGMVNPWVGGLKALYDHNEKFRNFVDNTWGKIKDIAGAVWDKMPDGVKDVFIKIKDLISGAIEKVKGIINGIKDFFSGLWQAIKEGPASTFEYLKNAFFGLVEKIKTIFGGLKNFFGGVFNGIKGAASKAWEGIKSGAAKAGSFLKNNWKTIAIGMVNPWAGGLKLLYDKNEKFRNLVDNSWGKIKDTAGKVWDKMPDGVKNALIKIKDIISGVIDKIKSIITAFRDFFTGLFGAIKEGPTATVEYIRDKFFGMFERIKEKLTAFVDFFKNKISSVKDFFGGIGDKIGGVFSTVKNKLTGHAEGGIFTHRHIAEIAEKGAEAVVPLNKSPQGYDIWKKAGAMGGYMQTASKQKAASGAADAKPAAMTAATHKATGGETIVNIDFKMTNNFNSAPDKEAVSQISSAGQKAGDDFAARVTKVVEDIMRNNRRVSYA